MLKLIKQDGERAYLVGVFTNRFQDREQQTITDDAHRDFEKFLNENPSNAPLLLQRHSAKLAFEARAEWWGYSGAFFAMAWPISADEVSIVEDMSARYGELGMSHGANEVVVEIDEATGKEIITKYRSYEASILPLKRAANHFTEVKIVEDEKMAFTEQQKAMLPALIAGVIADLEKELDTKAEGLEQSGVFTKDVEGGEHPEPEPITEAVVEEDEQPEPVPNVEMAEVREVITALASTVIELKAQVDTLTKSVVASQKREQQARVAIAQPSWAKQITAQFSKSNINNDDTDDVLEDGDQLLLQSPKAATNGNHALAGLWTKGV